MTRIAEKEYVDYLRTEVKLFQHEAEDRRSLSTADVSGLNVQKVLDVGCGAGQELIPFAEQSGVLCIGIDVETSAGGLFRSLFDTVGSDERTKFVRGMGEAIPFADGSFDVVICRVALPYMHNLSALEEIARVLRPGGLLLLRTHSPWFYLGMIGRRLRELKLRRLAYPVICLAGGVWHWATGHQPRAGTWSRKEVFQTSGQIRRLVSLVGMRIVNHRRAENREARSYVIEKNKVCLLAAKCLFGSDMLYLGLSVIH